MSDIQRLELLSEDIKNQIDELQSLLEHSDKYLLKKHVIPVQKELEQIIDNLTSYNDGVYSVFEELNATNNTEELQKENEVMHSLLQDRLTWEEKIDLRIKHGMDIF